MGSGSSVEGFRVIQVLPGSPLEEGGLQSYIDFIVEANGVRLNSHTTFQSIVSKSIGTRLDLKVFNVVGQDVREEVVVPRQDWGGSGVLGGTVRFEEWSADADFGIKVLSVMPGSPAEVAGLVPEEDYILGTDAVTLRNVDHLVSLILQAGKELLVYVYNAGEKRVRTVTLRLQEGKTQLGIDAGTGAVHSLKARSVREAKAKSDQQERNREVDSQPPIAIPPPVISPPVQEQVVLPPPPAFTASTVPNRPQKEKSSSASAPHVLKNPFQTD